MDIPKIVETIASIGVVGVGVIYVVGGLIVNLHLSRYGVTEYQILKVKYLVVGLTYLTNFIAILLLSAIPAIFVAVSDALVQQALLVTSLIASVWLLWLWGKPTETSMKSPLLSWSIWIVIGTVSSIFPIMAGLRLILTNQVDYGSVISVVEATLSGVLSFVGQTYYYSRHLYGRSNTVFGSVDPIGMGIPVHVQLAIESANISLLSGLGVPVQGIKTTDDVLLLDETDAHYLIGISREGHARAVKVAKDLVKAILYC